MERKFVVSQARFHREDPGIYILQGYFQGNTMEGSEIRAYAGSRELPVETGIRKGLAVRQKYFSLGSGENRIDREYDFSIRLPEEPFKSLAVVQILQGKRMTVYKVSAKRLQKNRLVPDHYLETWQESPDESGRVRVRVGGWAVGRGPCVIRVLDGRGRKLQSTTAWHYRPDIRENYPEIPEGENERFGFETEFEKPEGSFAWLLITARGQKTAIRLNLRKGERNVSSAGPNLLTKAAAYYRRNGLGPTLRRIRFKTREALRGSGESYGAWKRRRDPDKETLAAQRKSVMAKMPKISIVVPLYKTDEGCLRALVSSVQAQSYENWELCLSDGSGSDSPLTGVLAELSAKDPRIRVCASAGPLGISENTNKALEIASGEYIAFCDHDDLLAPQALYEFVRRINEDGADFLYSDEDKVSMDGRSYFEPHFKPDFSPELLTSMNYICHMVVVSRGLLERTGPLRGEFDGAQDYDFVLRASEAAEKIAHVPGALYHWRSHRDSTAANPESKRYAFEAGARAVQAYYDRAGIRAKVLMGPYPGLYETVYDLPEEEPLISVIIPNKDHGEDLEKCVHSLIGRSDWKNLEVLVIENGSEKEETFTCYAKLQRRYENVRILTWEKPFNYAAINNFGAAAAKGEYLLLLNNDTELIAPGSLAQMAGALTRPGAGIAGARLLYPDGTIQHAGVVIGYGGIAGHAFAGAPADGPGYFSRIIAAGNYSAVTAACLMVRKSVYEQAGGMDEAFRVAFNDVDFCLRVRSLGLRVIYQPDALFYHYESKSRGYEDSPEKIARFNDEADRFLKRWGGLVAAGDPYYNPNLSLDSNDFSLQR